GDRARLGAGHRRLEAAEPEHTAPAGRRRGRAPDHRTGDPLAVCGVQVQVLDRCRRHDRKRSWSGRGTVAAHRDRGAAEPGATLPDGTRPRPPAPRRGARPVRPQPPPACNSRRAGGGGPAGQPARSPGKRLAFGLTLGAGIPLSIRVLANHTCCNGRGDGNISRAPQRGMPVREGPRINHMILAPKVLVIDHEGANRGEMSVDEAVALAEEVGLDLVEVSPHANPPVCKILDYGKFKYQEQKKASEARKKQKTIDIKEVKMRPNIDTHDYEVKLRSMRRFFEEGDKVKVTLRFRGREMAHPEIGMQLLQRVREETDEIAKVEAEP